MVAVDEEGEAAHVGEFGGTEQVLRIPRVVLRDLPRLPWSKSEVV